MKTISDLICKRRIDSCIKNKQTIKITKVLELEVSGENNRLFMVKTNKLNQSGDFICFKVNVLKIRGKYIKSSSFIKEETFNLYDQTEEEHTKEFKYD